MKANALPDRNPGDPLRPDCQHAPGEDCMTCTKCGRCRETLDAADVCDDCRAQLDQLKKPPRATAAAARPAIGTTDADYYTRHHARDHRFPNIWQHVCPLCAMLQTVADAQRPPAPALPCPDVNRLRAIDLGNIDLGNGHDDEAGSEA
jgi:hypothetical protein